MKPELKAISLQDKLFYRPDIDGLRALAVIAVVIYHAFPSLLPGGFIGVDIFFVISGYLISSIIFKGLLRGEFSFFDFYMRRANRIFPALILVLLASYIAGWFIMLPDEFAQLGKHITGGAGFIQNIVLWKESGYFDVQSELKPLMHLWSLAVEEQFYLVYPVLIWLAYRARLNIVNVLILLLCLSFFMNIYTLGAESVKAYFSPQTRFWEILAGSILAYFYVFREATIESKGLKSFISLSGATFLVVALLLIGPEKDYPGWWAVLPVFGSLLMLMAGPEGIANRLILSNRAAVFVGLISYPLYLWHWPVLSFMRILNSDEPPYPARILAVALSFGLAWLTFRALEVPLRSLSRKYLKAAALCLSLMLVGFVGYKSFRWHGLDFRSVVALNNFLETGQEAADKSFIVQGCGMNDAESKKMAICVHDNRGETRFALIGDSKASALAPGVFAKSSTAGRWMFIGGNGENSAPVPVISDDKVFSAFQPRIKAALGSVTNNKKIEVVVLVTATRALFNLQSISSIEDLPRSGNFEIAFQGLSKAVNEIIKSGKKVVLVIDNPTLPDAKMCFIRVTSFSKVRAFPDPEKCDISYERHIELSARYRELLERVRQEHPEKVAIFDPTDLLCDSSDKHCRIVSTAGRLMYGYSDHISEYASNIVASKLIPFVESYSRM